MTTTYEVPTWETGMEKLTPSVYAYLQSKGSTMLSNAGLIVGKDYCIVVDTLHTVGVAQAFLDEIKKITDKPVRYLAITHQDGDHFHGNHLFTGANIIGHRRCREEMLKQAPINQTYLSQNWPQFDWTGITRIPPDITFEKQLTLHLDEGEVQLIYYGIGHTVGDIIAWIPQESVVFAGDLLFLYSTPLCRGSFAGSIDILKTMLDLDAKVYVPGHGPACGKEGVAECRDYLVLIYEEG